jgi:Tol biopolymer transport system component
MLRYAILLAVAVVATTTSVNPSAIAFASKRDGHWEIDIASPDGVQRTRLTTRAEQARFPLWSPDGTRLAFGVLGGATGETWQLWTMNADGSGAVRITDSAVAKGHRQWSRDGTHIVLEKMRDGHRVIVVARADGGGLTPLTDGRADDRDPMFSPDGARIVFSSTRGGRESIWVMRADGSAPTRVTSGAGEETSPTWSPDGSTIAFTSSRDGERDLYRVRPDGSALERLTSGAGVTRDLSQWSPDGSAIVIQTVHGKNYDVELVRIADRARTPIAASPAYDGQFALSPDGRSIAFISDRDGFDALYVADASGAHARRITSEPSLNPAWRP